METNHRLGGYTPFRKLEKEDETLFTQVMTLSGVDYKPVAVATQIVSGTNYCFLCEAKPLVHEPNPYNALIKVYKPLNDKPVIVEIKRIEIM